MRNKQINCSQFSGVGFLMVGREFWKENWTILKDNKCIEILIKGETDTRNPW